MAATAAVSERGAERVRRRHCWVYRGDIVDLAACAGEVVRVVDGRGRSLGIALYSAGSQIALRMVSFDDVTIDREFWHRRLAAAESLRSRVVRGSTAYRLVYGESDLLPSLIIDRYDDCFVIQTLSQGMEALKQVWIDLLVERYAPRAIIERNESRVRDLEGLPRVARVAYGRDPGGVEIGEAGVRFVVDLIRGQKTGAFLDQRENRAAAGGYARGRALDCFTYEGGFALHMARAADSVIAIDVSSAALERAKSNAELNGLSDIELITGNVFDLLREFESARQRFDTIVLDPPAFAKNKASVAAALRGYKEINLRAIKLLNEGGTLITSTCSFHMSEDAFLNVLAAASADAGRTVRVLEKRMQARDHPVLISMPETHYLKCIVAVVD